MNCVIYLRVSTKEQAQKADSNEGYSIPAQREACVKYIEEKGWKLIDEYTDRGESARSKDRPQLQEMLSRIKKEKDVQVVVVHKIDRLARNMEDHITIKAILKRAGTVLESVMENIEDSASGNLVEGIHALMAEFYSANLATEVKKGMAEKAKRGGWPFKAPVGYKNERKGFRKNSISKIVVDPETAPHIKEAFQLYGTGNYSTHDIREFLVQRGVTNRRGGNNPMALSSVNALLLNPIYIGLIPWKGVNYPGNHEALIDEDTFEKVQEVMNVHNVAGERTRKHPHYLKGTLYCGECGSRMSVDVAKKKYVYFYCVGQKKKFTKCKELYVNTVDIEKEIEQMYENIQLTQDQIEKIKKDFNEKLIGRQSNNAMEEQFLGKRITKLADEKLKLMKAYYAGAIELDVLKAEQDRISAEMKSSEKRLKTIRGGLDQYRVILDKAAHLASNCSEAYKQCKPKTKRLFNQAFFEKLYVKDRKIYKVEYTDLFGALFDESSNKDDLVGDGGLEPPTPCL